MANCDKDRLTDVMVAFCVAGSMNDISRTNASSEPPKSCKQMLSINPMHSKKDTYFDYPCWRFLCALEHALSANDSSFWINSPVKDVNGLNVCAVWIGVFMPHSDHYV